MGTHGFRMAKEEILNYHFGRMPTEEIKVKIENIPRLKILDNLNRCNMRRMPFIVHGEQQWNKKYDLMEDKNVMDRKI